jgi:hypothetical protein
MYICYLDESGTQEIGGNTNHFVLVGLAVPADKWKRWDDSITAIKSRYQIHDTEVHTGWIIKPYLEQESITGFLEMDYTTRREEVEKARKVQLRLSAATKDPKTLGNKAKLYRKTAPYIHLTMAERYNLISELCKEIGTWEDARLFGEAFDKMSLASRPAHLSSPYEQAFENIVSRFNYFLVNRFKDVPVYGLIVPDNNETVARKLSDMMRRFHQNGTLWTTLDRVIETPFFIDSKFTNMIQIADICGYATRRFFDYGETGLFDYIYNRYDRVKSRVVGLRHYVPHKECRCRVCIDHSRPYFDYVPRG